MGLISCILALFQGLSADKEGLSKLKNALKDLSKAGNCHATSELELSKVLGRMGECVIIRGDEPDDIGTAFNKFATVTQDLSSHMKSLCGKLEDVMLLPVDKMLKNELRGSKGDLKRPFDRSWKEYHDKFAEVERQKKKAAKDVGLHRSDLTAGEFADDMDKERKYLQLTTAEYFIRLNEIKTKKGVQLIQNMLEYYKAQQRYFEDGLDIISHFGNYVEDLHQKLHQIQRTHEEERHSLMEVRTTLKNCPGFNKVLYEKFWHEAMMNNTFQMVLKMRDRFKDDSSEVLFELTR
eukprot:maker-scaffold1490_size38656-snap-gene-0.8 protein:Tk09436 transcript:maker-scaffold1490_size38656-snap-gene-0.8-mRNA-1 annotation:"arf-gap with sh3 ank repeat and ph domain-containing protein 1"